MPGSWKSAQILPLSKLGKDPANAGNYMSIALTCHLYKWIEKIIINGLSYLEQRGLLSTYQSGFPIERSTVHALVKVRH